MWHMVAAVFHVNFHGLMPVIGWLLVLFCLAFFGSFALLALGWKVVLTDDTVEVGGVFGVRRRLHRDDIAGFRK